MHSTASLYNSLNELLLLIDQQIKMVEVETNTEGANALSLKYGDGKYIMPDLLLAKAQVLSAMTELRLEKKK